MQETQETWVRSLGWEDPLEESMATHSSILAWRIWWTEEPGVLQSTRLERVGHNRVMKHSTKRNDANELIYKTETDSQTSRTNLLVTTEGGWGEGVVREFEIDMYILLGLNWITNNDLLYGIRNSVPFYVVAWTKGAFGENGHMYMCMVEYLCCPP